MCLVRSGRGVAHLDVPRRGRARPHRGLRQEGLGQVGVSELGISPRVPGLRRRAERRAKGIDEALGVVEAVGKGVGHRAREDVAKRRHVRAWHVREIVGRTRAGRRRPAAPEHLVRQYAEAEHVGPSIPGAAAHALRRGVRPAHGCRDPDALERTRDPQPGHTHVIERHKKVAWVEGAVHDTPGGGDVERAGHLRDHPHHVGRARRATVAEHGLEGVGGHEVLREVRGHTGDAGGDRRGNGRVRQIGGDELLELSDQSVHAIGREIESEELDRDEAVLLGLVRTKHGTERTRPNLMENPEWTECVRRRSAGGFRVQRQYSSSGLRGAKASDRNTSVLRGAPVL